MRVSVRGHRFKVEPELRDEVVRGVYFALGRFADVIREVTVHLSDLNGPRGGLDKHSKAVVVLKTSEQVIAEATDVNMIAAVDQLNRRVRRLVARAVERRNEPPNARSVPGDGIHKEI